MTHVVDVLRQAVEARDPDEFEDALNLCSGLELLEGAAELLISVLMQDWHTWHEDVASVLQDLRWPGAVDALRQRALSAPPDYLASDNGEALARKCTWALADTGTPDAKAALKGLEACDIPAVCEYARKRLERWDAEMARKL